jgi:hypothetical protein
MQDYTAIVGACCVARNAIADDAECIRSLCLYPYIQKVIGSARWNETPSLSDGASERLPQRPFQTGVRLPRKASIPSLKSSLM